MDARAGDGFHHSAWMYRGEEEVAAGAGAFLREGLEAGEAMLVAVAAPKIELLRSELGPEADTVTFLDMAAVGANPARIIPAWRAFVARRPAGASARGIGEPIGPDRAGAELVECHGHESLLNLAFADTAAFRLMCPYDTEALDPAVVEKARGTHPFLTRGSETTAGAYAPHSPFGEPLPDVPPGARQTEIHLGSLSDVREFVGRHGARAGLSAQRVSDLVAAVNEVATNSVRHGGGRGRLRLWNEPGALVCEVRDAGHIEDPLVGRIQPRRGQIGGYGLWLTNQLCDLVQIRSQPTGTAVRLHMRLDPPA
jgi:anti-sigma regulatory factor (Ser/Thr protein kinase)